VPAALAPEDRQGGGDAVQDAAQVDVDHGVPVVDVEVGEGCDPGGSGVAHQDVEASEPIHRQAHQSLDVGALRDVDFQHLRATEHAGRSSKPRARS
jgi:hypothetical protein